MLLQDVEIFIETRRYTLRQKTRQTAPKGQSAFSVGVKYWLSAFSALQRIRGLPKEAGTFLLR